MVSATGAWRCCGMRSMLVDVRSSPRRLGEEGAEDQIIEVARLSASSRGISGAKLMEL